MKQRLILIIAVVMGLLAAFLLRQFISAKEKEYNQMISDWNNKNTQIDVVVFTRDMPQDALIQRDDLRGTPVPSTAIRTGYVKQVDYASLIGKRTVNAVPMLKTIFWSDIEGGETSQRLGLANEILPGMRAISINVTGSASVSGMVQPNDHVDVIGTFILDAPDRPNEKEQVTLTILQNVTVIATGRETSRSLSRLTADRAASYSMVTLLVTPREAETLVACEQNRGRLTLALRKSSDYGYEDELPTVDFKYIRETLIELNKLRQNNLKRPATTPPVLR